MTENPKARLEELRLVLRAENMSYDELADLQSLVEHIEPGDVELLEAAGVPEFPMTQELEVTVKLHVRIKAATEDCEGNAYTRENLIRQIEGVVWDEMFMSEDVDSREDTDLVQQVLAVDIEEVKPPLVQLIHGRDPDSECGITVFIDDVQIPFDQVETEDIDPGRGYLRADWDERIAFAQEDTSNFGVMRVRELESFSDSQYIVGDKKEEPSE